MRMIKRSLEVLAVVAALAFQAMPAQAQPFAKTFVRSDGNDALLCFDLQNRCFSLARGIENVSPGGTVNLLDPNVHTAVVITNSLTILSEGGGNAIIGAVIGSPASGIFINLPSGNDIVTIRGIVIDQVDVNAHGITFIGAGTLHLQNCFIRGSANGFGINFIPTGTSELHISDCVIADNAPTGVSGGGILIQPSGAASVKVVLDNVRLENNRIGLFVNRAGTTGTITTVIRNSTIAGNVTGVGANASGTVVRVANSTISGNNNGLLVFSSGQIISHGGNILVNNTANGAFSATLPQQ